MNIEKDMKKEQLFYTIVLIVGLVIFIGAFLAKMAGLINLIGGITGFGGWFIGVGCVKLYQIKQNPQKYEERIIGEYDERNIAIRGYAGYTTFMITLVTLSITQAIYVWKDYTVPILLNATQFLIHLISFLIFARHYSKKI